MSSDRHERNIRAIVDAIRERRAVLFLGAGASKGAKDKSGKEIPDGSQLALILSEKLLGREYKSDKFTKVYSLACSSKGVRDVQKEIYDQLHGFKPAPHHLLIPTFPWAGLLTTNYDLVVERAYEAALSPLQTLRTFAADKDGVADTLEGRDVLYVKLHGCLTRHGDTEPPLVASTDQLIDSLEGRNGQFTTFLEWAKTKTIIFVGYARQRCLLDGYSEAHKIFHELKAAGLPYFVKKKIRGPVLDEANQLVRYTGVISSISDSFGFIRCAAPYMDAFFEIDVDSETVRQVKVGEHVSFTLAFNMFGPVVSDIQYELGI